MLCTACNLICFYGFSSMLQTGQPAQPGGFYNPSTFQPQQPPSSTSGQPQFNHTSYYQGQHSPPSQVTPPMGGYQGNQPYGGKVFSPSLLDHLTPISFDHLTPPHMTTSLPPHLTTSPPPHLTTSLNHLTPPHLTTSPPPHPHLP